MNKIRGDLTSREDRNYDFKSDLDLLYLPKEPMTSREPGFMSNNNKYSFTKFNDLKKTDAYIRKINDLTEYQDVVKSLCKRLVYNGNQKLGYLNRMGKESEDCYSKIVDRVSEWDRKNNENIKIIKR